MSQTCLQWENHVIILQLLLYHKGYVQVFAQWTTCNLYESTDKIIQLKRHV